MLWGVRAHLAAGGRARMSLVTFGAEATNAASAAPAPAARAAIGAHFVLLHCCHAHGPTYIVYLLAAPSACHCAPADSISLAGQSDETCATGCTQNSTYAPTHDLMLLTCAGLARTLFMESRATYGTSIDLPADSASASNSSTSPTAALPSLVALQTAACAGGEYALRLEAGRWSTLRLVPAAQPAPQPVVPAPQAALVSGGAKVSGNVHPHEGLWPRSRCICCKPHSMAGKCNIRLRLDPSIL